MSVDDVDSNEDDDYDYDTYGEGDDPMGSLLQNKASVLQEKASVHGPPNDEVETKEAQQVLDEADKVIQEKQGAQEALQEEAILHEEEAETKEAQTVLDEADKVIQENQGAQKALQDSQNEVETEEAVEVLHEQ